MAANNNLDKLFYLNFFVQRVLVMHVCISTELNLFGF